MMSIRRLTIEFLTFVVFVVEFFTNILRFVGLGRRYYTKNYRLDGKVVLITGANSGIGKETAYQLCKRGAKVFLCCRDLIKGKEAIEDIRKRLNSKNELHLMQLDLSSFRSINQFAIEMINLRIDVDILINNAGVMMCPRRMLSEDKHELQFATNHLGHFLLTHLILPLMTKSNDARILNVSSIHHIRGRINFGDLNFEKPNSYDPVDAYCQSKLANVLFTRKLAQILKENPKYHRIRTFALNPGTINTNLTRHIKGIRRTIYNILGTVFNLDTFSGTQTTLYCCLEPSLKSGAYYSNCQENKWLFQESKDIQSAQRLWDLSCKMTGIDSLHYIS
ncbi:tRNA pseudouridine 38/39 synthase [Sarcoptes scabiei]|nr:tRNA pseudouridine 38/39 synthase [Sarcoptes scabiei]